MLRADLLKLINPNTELIVWLDENTPNDIIETINYFTNGLILKNSQSSTYQFQSWNKQFILVKTQKPEELKKLIQSSKEAFKKMDADTLFIGPKNSKEKAEQLKVAQLYMF